jgi:protein involved in polysaccharide export with SLBB domain
MRAPNEKSQRLAGDGWRWALVGLALVWLGVGCSSQDFSAPVSTITDVIEPRQPQDRADEEAAQRRSEQLAKMMAAWEKSRIQTDRDYLVGTEDVLEIGILSLEKPGETSVLKRAIRQDGKIALPLVGDLEVRGTTLRDLEDRLADVYRGKYIKDPTVTLKVSEYRSAPVVLTGAVKKPGVYFLTRNKSSVLEVLSMADGISEEAGAILLIVRGKKSEGATNAVQAAAAPKPPSGAPAGSRPPLPFAARTGGTDPVEDSGGPAMAETGLRTTDRGDEKAMESDPDAVAMAADTDMVTVDLKRLVSEGDVRLNATVLGGDIVSVPPRKQQFVYVLGYVHTPGSVDMKDRDRVDALHAISMAGGLANSARAENSYVITERDSVRRVIKVDLTKVMRGVRQPVYLRSGDTLLIGSSPLAKLAEFIKPTVGASASLATPVP